MTTARKASAVLVAGLITGLVAGLALGVVWWKLAPRVPLRPSKFGRPRCARAA